MITRTIVCCRCSVEFGLTETFYNVCMRNGNTFYCPNGHPQHFAESLKDKLERERKLREFAENGRRRAMELRDRAERSAAATRGHLTRFRNRVSKGVCPCCTRSFQDLRRRMKTQHPDWVQE